MSFWRANALISLNKISIILELETNLGNVFSYYNKKEIVNKVFKKEKRKAKTDFC